MFKNLDKKIVNLAEELLAKGKKEKEVTMRLLAKKLDVSVGVLYCHYEDKDNIIYSVRLSLANDLEKLLEAASPESSEKEVILSTVSVQFIHMLCENTYLTRLLLQNKQDGLFDNFRDKLLKLIGEWMHSENIKEDPGRAESMFVVMACSTALYVRSQKLTDVSSEAEKFFKMFKHSVK